MARKCHKLVNSLVMVGEWACEGAWDEVREWAEGGRWAALAEEEGEFFNLSDHRKY